MLADLHDSVFFYCVHEEQGGEEFEISFGGMFDHHKASLHPPELEQIMLVMLLMQKIDLLEHFHCRKGIKH